MLLVLGAAVAFLHCWVLCNRPIPCPFMLDMPHDGKEDVPFEPTRHGGRFDMAPHEGSFTGKSRELNGKDILVGVSAIKVASPP